MNKIEKFYVVKNINNRKSDIEIGTGQFKVGTYDLFGHQNNEIQLTLHIKIPEFARDDEKVKWVTGMLNADLAYITACLKNEAKAELMAKFQKIEDNLKTQIVNDLQIQDFVGGKE